MSSANPEDKLFERLSEESKPLEGPGAAAPTRLKAKVYSALLRRQAEAGPLMSLTETEASGHALCVFEKLVEISPVGEKVKSINFCRVCHARIAAEKIENAPIYWPHCPYAEFQNH